MKTSQKEFIAVVIDTDSNCELIRIARQQGFVNRQGTPSRAQAVEYLLKNFQDKIA